MYNPEHLNNSDRQIIREHLKPYKPYLKIYHLKATKLRRLNNTIRNIHEELSSDIGFWQELHFTKEDIIKLEYIPENYKDVSTDTYTLLSHIAKYFNCIITCSRVIAPETDLGLKTITVYGYPLSCTLCHFYISKMLSTIDYVRYNAKEEIAKKRKKVKLKEKTPKPKYRKIRRKYERRTETVITDLPLPREYANSQKKEAIAILETLWKELLEYRTKDKERVLEIFQFLRGNRLLNFRRRIYKGEPRMSHAFCARKKFQINRIIYETSN